MSYRLCYTPQISKKKKRITWVPTWLWKKYFVLWANLIFTSLKLILTASQEIHKSWTHLSKINKNSCYLIQQIPNFQVTNQSVAFLNYHGLRGCCYMALIWPIHCVLLKTQLMFLFIPVSSWGKTSIEWYLWCQFTLILVLLNKDKTKY